MLANFGVRVCHLCKIGFVPQGLPQKILSTDHISQFLGLHAEDQKGLKVKIRIFFSRNHRNHQTPKCITQHRYTLYTKIRNRMTSTIETDSATCRIHHSKIKMPEPLKIEDSLVICSENELEPFISHPDHRTI